MSPSAAKAEAGADNSCGPRGGQGRAPANPKAVPLLTPTALLPHRPVPLRLATPGRRLPIHPLALYLTATTISTSPPLICLTSHIFRRQGRCHLLQKVFPGLLLSSSHSAPPLHSPSLNLDTCLGAIVALPGWGALCGQQGLSFFTLCLAQPLILRTELLPCNWCLLVCRGIV